MKKLILIIANGLTCFFFWRAVRFWLDDPLNWQTTGIWLRPLILLVLFTALTGLSFLFFNQKRWQWAVSGLNLALFFLVFYQFSELLLAAGALIFAALHYWAMASVDENKNNRLKFNLKESLRRGTHRIVTAILILISFVYFLTPKVQELSAAETLPAWAVQTIQNVTGRYLEEIMNVPDDRLKQQLAQEAVKQVNTWLNPYFKFLPPILAFGLFLVLQGLGFLFVWLSLAISLLIFIILRALKVVIVSKVNKEAEVVNF